MIITTWLSFIDDNNDMAAPWSSALPLPPVGSVIHYDEYDKCYDLVVTGINMDVDMINGTATIMILCELLI